MLSRVLIACLISTAACSAALADSVTGKILAFDRKANVIVLNDKTVWTLEGATTPAPADLVAGDRVEIEFESEGEEGLRKIDTMKRVAQ